MILLNKLIKQEDASNTLKANRVTSTIDSGGVRIEESKDIIIRSALEPVIIQEDVKVSNVKTLSLLLNMD